MEHLITLFLTVLAVIGAVYSGRKIILEEQGAGKYFLMFIFCLLFAFNAVKNSLASETRVEFCEFLVDHATSFEYKIVSPYKIDCEYLNEAFGDSYGIHYDDY